MYLEPLLFEFRFNLELSLEKVHFPKGRRHACHIYSKPVSSQLVAPIHMNQCPRSSLASSAQHIVVDNHPLWKRENGTGAHAHEALPFQTFKFYNTWRTLWAISYGQGNVRSKALSFFFAILGKMLRMCTWQWQLTDQLTMCCGYLIASCWLWYDITPSDKLCKKIVAIYYDHSLTKLCVTFLQARYSTSIVNIL